MKKEKISKYICLILFLAVNLSNLFLSANAENARPEISQIQSQAFVLMDGDTGQVLLERNMRDKMYPASITKIMTALLALESGKNMADIITMSYDAVWTVGRDTSHIALDEDERLNLEQALYALAIESANDAANGIAELVGGTMENFAKQMTSKAKELGAASTNFANAHGLHDANHYTTPYDMALIMAAAVKIPEFTKIFTAITYGMPPTNKQPEARTFNRRNSLLEGPYKYEGMIGEKTGWTSDSGFTYAAAARRNGRTLIAVVMRSPSEAVRWQDTAILFDYGFNEFVPFNYNADEFGMEKYIIEGADGGGIETALIPAGDFNCYILKSLNKEDIEIKYSFYADNITGKMAGKAVFSLKPGLSALMFGELGEANLRIYFGGVNTGENAVAVIGGGAITGTDGPVVLENDKKSVFSKIFAVISIVLQIIGVAAVILLILYIRRRNIIKKRKRQRRLNNYNRKVNRTYYK